MRAVEQLASARVMVRSKPIHASLHAVPPASLRFLEGIPGVNYAAPSLPIPGETKGPLEGAVGDRKRAPSGRAAELATARKVIEVQGNVSALLEELLQAGGASRREQRAMT